MANTPNQTSFSADNQPKNAGNRSGRARGTPNKFTKAIKDMVLEALEGAHPEGGVGYLREQASANPVAFMGLLAKIMPTQIQGDPDAPLVHEVRRIIVRPSHQDG